MPWRRIGNTKLLFTRAHSPEDLPDPLAVRDGGDEVAGGIVLQALQGHGAACRIEATKCALMSAGVGLALLERSEAQAAMQVGKLVIWDTPPLWCVLSVAYARQRAHDLKIQAVAASVCHV